MRSSPEDVDRLVAAYRAGRRTTTQLAAEFGVHPNTVQPLLQPHGLLLPLQKPDVVENKL